MMSVTEGFTLYAYIYIYIYIGVCVCVCVVIAKSLLMKVTYFRKPSLFFHHNLLNTLSEIIINNQMYQTLSKEDFISK